MADNTNVTVTTSVSDIMNSSTMTSKQPKRRGRPPKNPELAAQKKAEQLAKKKAEQEKRQKEQEEWKAAQAQKKDKNNPDYKDTRVDVRETSINCCSGDDFCTFYSSEVWGKNLAHKMLEEHPEDVKLVFEDPDDGAIEIRCPLQCIKYFKYPVKRTMTDEQKKAFVERVQNGRKNKEFDINTEDENESED